MKREDLEGCIVIANSLVIEHLKKLEFRDPDKVTYKDLAVFIKHNRIQKLNYAHEHSSNFGSGKFITPEQVLSVPVSKQEKSAVTYNLTEEQIKRVDKFIKEMKQ